MSVVIYANINRIVVPINTNSSKGRIYRLINQMKLICGARYTGKAIRFTNNAIFRRSRRTKVVIVITTGPSKDRVYRISQVLRTKRIESFAIGVGRHYKLSELRQIASDRHHVYTVGFRNIESLNIILRKKLCGRKYMKYFKSVLICKLFTNYH